MVQRPATEKPDGKPPAPFILLGGEEGAGKSLELARLSADPRVGESFVLVHGEDTIRQYVDLPGGERARFEVLRHDGTYRGVVAALEQTSAYAAEVMTAGEPPVVLGYDTGTYLWEDIKAWLDKRNRESRRNQQILQEDPDAALDIPMNLWNDGNSRYSRILTLMQTFPGIAVMTAQASEVTEVRGGRPVTGSMAWKEDAQKRTRFAANLHVRLHREP